MPKTKIVIISDTHGMHRKVKIPDGDILLHCGDALNHGTLNELPDFNNWLGELPHKHKIIIAGNHDAIFSDMPTIAKEMLTNAVYLEDSFVTVAGLKIYGSPWTRHWGYWSFMESEERLKERWKLIPNDVDILMTHGPAFELLDEVPSGENTGSPSLLKVIERIRPKLFESGHIHNSYGETTYGGITIVNAAICTEAYKPINKPIVVEL